MRPIRVLIQRIRSWATRARLTTMREECWEYKVVQMVAQVPSDPGDASRKLGGMLSAETLRSQFPEHYGGVNGRQQINDFLNKLGDDHWELVQIQQIGELPLMIFKRPKQLSAAQNGAKPDTEASVTHAKKTV